MINAGMTNPRRTATITATATSSVSPSYSPITTATAAERQALDGEHPDHRHESSQPQCGEAGDEHQSGRQIEQLDERRP